MHIPLFSRDGFGRFWGLQKVNFPISSPVFGAVGVVGGFATAKNCDFLVENLEVSGRLIVFFAQNYHFDILLTEEIMHHLGCIKPCQYWDKLRTSTGELDVFHQQYVMGPFPWTEQRTRWKHGRAHVRVFYWHVLTSSMCKFSVVCFVIIPMVSSCIERATSSAASHSKSYWCCFANNYTTFIYVINHAPSCWDYGNLGTLTNQPTWDVV